MYFSLIENQKYRNTWTEVSFSCMLFVKADHPWSDMHCQLHIFRSRPTVAGIHGNALEGCYSLALSGGYEDDVDYGDCFTYTGEG